MERSGKMITKDNNNFKIHFTKEFYSEETLKKACEDFKEFFDYELNGEDLTIIPKEEVEDLPYKFCNYVFQLENDKN